LAFVEHSLRPQNKIDDFKKRNISYSLGVMKMINVPPEESLKNELQEISEALIDNEYSSYHKKLNLITDTWTVIEAARESASLLGDSVDIINNKRYSNGGFQ
jgi:galactose-1-phosphate uridylyltransferase